MATEFLELRPGLGKMLTFNKVFTIECQKDADDLSVCKIYAHDKKGVYRRINEIRLNIDNIAMDSFKDINLYNSKADMDCTTYRTYYDDELYIDCEKRMEG